VWNPSRRFKENFTIAGFFIVSVFVIGLLSLQCGLWVLIPIFALVIVLKRFKK
jgi:hypothetical protein